MVAETFDRKKRSPNKPFLIDFWKRDVGATWLAFERKRIDEFSKVKTNEKVSISGYVKWVTASVFALVPTLFSNQIHLICVNHADKQPFENSYVTISAIAKFERIRPQLQSTNSRIFEGNKVLHVQDWTYERPHVEIPKSYLDYKDFTKNLTYRIEDLEPQIRDFLAFTAISTPTFYENAGGINLTLYDSTKGESPRLSLSRFISQEMKRAIPEGMGNSLSVATCYGTFRIGYNYAFLVEDADKPLSQQTEDLLAHKVSRFMPDCTESSMSLFSAKNKPVTIEDLPCRLSDIPTVVPEKASANRKRRSIDPFDAFNFIVSNHFKAPIITDLKTSLKEIADRLEKLSSDYDLDPKHLTQYGFLNANYNARPTSVLRYSLSHARAQSTEVVNPQLITKTFDDFFKWNFKYVYEVWEDLLTKPLVGGKDLPSLRIKYREIIRIIRKYHSSRVSGVSRNDIIKEAEVSPLETEQLIDECNNAGIIYQPVMGFYRLTRDDA